MSYKYLIRTAKRMCREATRRERRRRGQNGVHGVGCQDSWREINRTHVELCTTLAVNLNLNMSS